MLLDAEDAAMGAALIQDYFFVNDEITGITEVNTATVLVGPFCVEGPSVLKFELSATTGSMVADDIVVDAFLMVNNMVVA